MKVFNYIFVTFLCMLLMFVMMTLQRLALQDSRIRALDDRMRTLERPEGQEARHAFEHNEPARLPTGQRL
jgi:hypothetical protein